MKWTLTFIALVSLALIGTVVSTDEATFVDYAHDMAIDAQDAQDLAQTMAQEAEELRSLLEADAEEGKRRPSKRHAQKVAAKAAKKASKKTAKAVALKKLAKELKKSGKKGRAQLLKNKSQLKSLAKSLGLSAKVVKKAIKHPNKAVKKAKKLAKKAKKSLKKGLKKAKKEAKKAKVAKKKLIKKAAKKAKALKKKFQPKVKGLMMKKTPITKKIKKVVENEPESAAIQKAKNNWAWEDTVMGRLDKYVPPDPKNIKARVKSFDAEADEACGKAEGLCVQQKIQHPLNAKTCIKAKKACFHAKVGLEIITKAATVCVDAQKVCGPKDWMAKGNCLVAKAQCKRLLNGANYQYDKVHKVARQVRHMEFHDGEANAAIDDLSKKSKVVMKAQAKFDKEESKAEKCAETIKKATQCDLDMDESPACVKAQDQLADCKKVTAQFKKTKEALKIAQKTTDKATQMRNIAQTEAKMGAN